MFTRDENDDRSPQANVCFRLPPSMKAELLRRAQIRSQREDRDIRMGQVVRDLLVIALKVTAEGEEVRTPQEEMMDEIYLSALFSRHALEVALRKHEGVTERLLRTCRAKLQQWRRGRRVHDRGEGA